MCVECPLFAIIYDITGEQDSIYPHGVYIQVRRWLVICQFLKIDI